MWLVGTTLAGTEHFHHCRTRHCTALAWTLHRILDYDEKKPSWNIGALGALLMTQLLSASFVK